MNNQIYIEAVEKELEKCCDEFFYDDSVVSKAAKYSLLSSGKRIRATLIFITAKMCDKNWRDYLRFACAVEMVHCYSLIHDDMPCMDNDDLRRGKPSCHKAFGEATALLAGDALLGCGLETISNDKNFSDLIKVKAMKLITKAMGPKGMIFGQELDLKYENIPADKDTLNTIHQHKTGRLISLCGQLGSLDTNLTNVQNEALNLFFENIGIVFQIIDDILDVEGDVNRLGKPIGSDADNNKSTFISLYGLDESKRIAKDMTDKANKAIKLAFGNNSDEIIEYTTYLLNRKK